MYNEKVTVSSYLIVIFLGVSFEGLSRLHDDLAESPAFAHMTERGRHLVE